MDHQKYDEDDHLLDDLMNIVQNDDSIKKFEAIQSGSNNKAKKIIVMMILTKKKCLLTRC